MTSPKRIRKVASFYEGTGSRLERALSLVEQRDPEVSFNELALLGALAYLSDFEVFDDGQRMLLAKHGDPAGAMHVAHGKATKRPAKSRKVKTSTPDRSNSVAQPLQGPALPAERTEVAHVADAAPKQVSESLKRQEIAGADEQSLDASDQEMSAEMYAEAQRAAD